MKSRRLQKPYRSNASKLHKKVGDLLRASSIFSGRKLYQEYPCNLVNPDFPDGKCKFDWVILDLKIVIECHGIQHYAVQTFGGEAEEAIAIFNRMKKRDEAKKEAALLAGFSYLVIPYWDEKIIDETYILNLIHICPEVDCLPVQKPTKPEPTPYQLAVRERNRQYRKAAYAKNKERIKEFRKQNKVGVDDAKLQRYHGNYSAPQD